MSEISNVPCQPFVHEKLPFTPMMRPRHCGVPVKVHEDPEAAASMENDVPDCRMRSAAGALMLYASKQPSTMSLVYSPLASVAFMVRRSTCFVTVTPSTLYVRSARLSPRVWKVMLPTSRRTTSEAMKPPGCVG